MKKMNRDVHKNVYDGEEMDAPEKCLCGSAYFRCGDTFATYNCGTLFNVDKRKWRHRKRKCYEAEIATLREKRDEAIEIIRDLEWSIHIPDDPDDKCPECGRPKSVGTHANTCRIGTALGRPKAYTMHEEDAEEEE